MRMRGVEKQNSSVTTSAMLGGFQTNQKTREEFMKLITRAVTRRARGPLPRAARAARRPRRRRRSGCRACGGRIAAGDAAGACGRVAPRPRSSRSSVRAPIPPRAASDLARLRARLPDGAPLVLIDHNQPRAWWRRLLGVVVLARARTRRRRGRAIRPRASWRRSASTSSGSGSRAASACSSSWRGAGAAAEPCGPDDEQVEGRERGRWR